MLGADQFTKLEDMFINAKVVTTPTPIKNALVTLAKPATTTSVRQGYKVRDDKCLPSTINNANKVLSLLTSSKQGLAKQDIILSLKLTGTEYDSAIEYLKRHKKVLLMGSPNKHGRWVTI